MDGPLYTTGRESSLDDTKLAYEGSQVSVEGDACSDPDEGLANGQGADAATDFADGYKAAAAVEDGNGGIDIAIQNISHHGSHVVACGRRVSQSLRKQLFSPSRRPRRLPFAGPLAQRQQIVAGEAVDGDVRQRRRSIFSGVELTEQTGGIFRYRAILAHQRGARSLHVAFA
jgi:hypothetical protein